LQAFYSVRKKTHALKVSRRAAHPPPFNTINSLTPDTLPNIGSSQKGGNKWRLEND